MIPRRSASLLPTSTVLPAPALLFGAPLADTPALPAHLRDEPQPPLDTCTLSNHGTAAQAHPLGSCAPPRPLMFDYRGRMTVRTLFHRLTPGQVNHAPLSFQTPSSEHRGVQSWDSRIQEDVQSVVLIPVLPPRCVGDISLVFHLCCLIPLAARLGTAAPAR